MSQNNRLQKGSNSRTMMSLGHGNPIVTFFVLIVQSAQCAMGNVLLHVHQLSSNIKTAFPAAAVVRSLGDYSRPGKSYLCRHTRHSYSNNTPTRNPLSSHLWGWCVAFETVPLFPGHSWPSKAPFPPPAPGVLSLLLVLRTADDNAVLRCSGQCLVKDVNGLHCVHGGSRRGVGRAFQRIVPGTAPGVTIGQRWPVPLSPPSPKRPEVPDIPVPSPRRRGAQAVPPRAHRKRLNRRWGKV